MLETITAIANQQTSPIEKRYPIGTELLITRSDGWAHIRNPISKHTGWMLEQHYLAPPKSASSQIAGVELGRPAEPDFDT